MLISLATLPPSKNQKSLLEKSADQNFHERWDFQTTIHPYMGNTIKRFIQNKPGRNFTIVTTDEIIIKHFRIEIFPRKKIRISACTWVQALIRMLVLEYKHVLECLYLSLQVVTRASSSTFTKLVLPIFHFSGFFSMRFSMS